MPISDNTTMWADLLDIFGVNDPESIKAFEEKARTLAKKLVSVAMYGATGAEEGDKNITYKLVNIALASYALDVAASVMGDHLNTKKVEVVSDPVFKELIEALSGDKPADPSQDQNGTATKLKNFQDHFGIPS